MADDVDATDFVVGDATIDVIVVEPAVVGVVGVDAIVAADEAGKDIATGDGFACLAGVGDIAVEVVLKFKRRLTA